MEVTDDPQGETDPPFTFRRIAVPAFGPSLLFGLGEGAILPIIPLSVRHLGGSVALAALVVTLIGIGSLICNIPASIITTRYGERWAIVAAAVWSAAAMALCLLVAEPGPFAAGVLHDRHVGAVFGLARQSYLTDAVPLHFRARALSTLGGVMRIGLFIGPFLAAAVDPVFRHWRGAYCVGIAGARAGRRRRDRHARPAGEHHATAVGRTLADAAARRCAARRARPPAHLPDRSASA